MSSSKADIILRATSRLASRSGSTVSGFVQTMDAFQIIELIAEWMAGGDVFRAIEMNQSVYGYTDEQKKWMINTAISLLEFTINPGG